MSVAPKGVTDMCDGNYGKDPVFVAKHRDRFKRESAAYFLRDRYKRISGKSCVYCGFKAETGDHVPSLFAGYTNGVVKGVLVPVCTDCNQVLGPFSSTCLKERLTLIALVFDQLAAKNQGFANDPNGGPQWGEKAAKFREKSARCMRHEEEVSCQMLTWE